jgi:hypothetical protein
MNNQYLPPHHSDAYTLLAVISDPAAAKKNLDELGTALQAIKQAEAGAREAAKQAEMSRAENEKLIAELAIAERDNSAKLKLIAAARLDERESALAAREEKISRAETSAAAALANAAALKSKWEKRMDKLKAVQADTD